MNRAAADFMELLPADFPLDITTLLGLKKVCLFSRIHHTSTKSPQGWVPSTFTSSRSERASKKQTRPEDFMDEEDLAAVQESKKLVDITEETDLFGGTQAELAQRSGSEVEKEYDCCPHGTKSI